MNLIVHRNLYSIIGVHLVMVESFSGGGEESVEEWKSSIVDPSDDILNAGRIDFILRPVIEQEGLDRLEEGDVVDDVLDIIVGGDGGRQDGKVIARTGPVK